MIFEKSNYRQKTKMTETTLFQRFDNEIKKHKKLIESNKERLADIYIGDTYLRMASMFTSLGDIDIPEEEINDNKKYSQARKEEFNEKITYSKIIIMLFRNFLFDKVTPIKNKEFGKLCVEKLTVCCSNIIEAFAEQMECKVCEMNDNTYLVNCNMYKDELVFWNKVYN